jgi:polyferredoxin
MNKKRRIAPSRIVQVLFTIGINAYILAYIQGTILYQGFLKRIPQPVLNCYGGPLSLFACPIGSTQQMVGMKLIPWLPLGIFIVIGALVGRAACGWLCPFGLWQDLLHKVKVGPKAGAKRWWSAGVIAAVTAAIAAGLIILGRLQPAPVLLFGWLPFNAVALVIAWKGKVTLPARVWLGGFLAGVGLAVFVWFKFGPSFGVVACVFGMTLFGLTGRWVAAALAAVAGLLLGWLGPQFALGPLGGPALGAALGALGFAVVFVIDRLLRVSLPSNLLKFAFLLLVAGVAAYFTAEPWFCKLCPNGTFEAGIPLVLWDPVQALRGLVGWLYWVKIGILLAAILAAIAIKRPFCRLVCPIGAIYSLFNKVSLLHLKKKDGCTDCGLCRRVCPMDIEPQQAPNQLECIRCFECAWRCPKSSLSIRA